MKSDLLTLLFETLKTTLSIANYYAGVLTKLLDAI
jgi:hypothetical protein